MCLDRSQDVLAKECLKEPLLGDLWKRGSAYRPTKLLSRTPGRLFSVEKAEKGRKPPGGRP